MSKLIHVGDIQIVKARADVGTNAGIGDELVVTAGME